MFRHVAGLMRAALAPEAAAANGLTAAALSALLSDLWFGPTPHSYKGKGTSHNPAPVAYCSTAFTSMQWRRQTSVMSLPYKSLEAAAMLKGDGGDRCRYQHKE